MDARRTALPRSLLTRTLRSDLHYGNGSNGLGGMQRYPISGSGLLRSFIGLQLPLFFFEF
jgi:hypothetical protein